MSNKFLPLVIGAAMGVAATTAAGATTLEDVKAKGFIQCGVSQGLPGFSNPDAQGTGPVSTLTTAALWLQQCSAMRPL